VAARLLPSGPGATSTLDARDLIADFFSAHVIPDSFR